MRVVSEPRSWMVRLPAPTRPRTTDCAAAAPVFPTTVEFGVRVLMIALAPKVGTPPLQLPALNQLLSIVPVQKVWARVDTVDAESNAITAVVVSRYARICSPPAK